MRRNKLYTVNQWNRPVFMPKEKNLFFPGGSFDLSAAANDYFDGSSAKRTFDMNLGTSKEQQYLASKNALGISKAANPFSKANLAGVGKAAGAAALSAGAGLLGGLANSAISGGLESGAGSAISGLGSTVGGAIGTVNPVVGAAVSVGSQLLGGLANRAFGSKLNEENINQINNENAAINQSGAAIGSSTTNEDVLNSAGNLSMGTDFDQDFIGEDGWFSSKAKDKYNELKKEQLLARKYAANALLTGANNADINMDDNVMANFSAFGGPLFAFGGDLQVNGGDFPTGLTHIDAGLSHELNPNDGVQLGVDPEGVPNLVEEGEVVWNDYVYSNRIKVDDETKKKFHIGKKREITYADLAKKLEKEIEERPNDPISRAGFEAQMQFLEDEQERQKQQMEAEKAKLAFESLSPEEQVAVMQQAAAEEQAAQQAVMQQQAQQQQAMAEQQQMEQQPMMQADGSQAVLGPEAPMMAEGGHLLKKGGYKWDNFWEPVNEYSKKAGNNKNKYQIDKTYKGNIKDLENSEAYKAFTNYILNEATDDERQKYFDWIDKNTGHSNKYLTDGKLVDNWKEMFKSARTDGLYGIQHYTPERYVDTEEAVVPTVTDEPHTPQIHHALEGDDDYIEGELDPNIVGDEVRRSVLTNGDTVIYHARKAPAKTSETPEETEETGVAPIHRAEWPRYAGLLGPAVGLGMMAAGVGKPNYGRLDVAVDEAGNVALADYKPIGNYLRYQPMDIWFEQNRLNANSRATDRAILNSGANQGSKMAGLLASGYNDQIASGDLYRKALEYNDAKRKDVAEFNRGTDQFNAEAYNRLSQFNASARNQATQHKTNLALQAARERMDADAGWYNSLYGNVSGLFKGLSDLGRENAQWNIIADSAADGVYGNLGTSNTSKRVITQKKKSKGGKLNKRRGLTF